MVVLVGTFAVSCTAFFPVDLLLQGPCHPRYTTGLPSSSTATGPDPGEEYYHVSTQLFGHVNPPKNRHHPFNHKPFNLPKDGDLPDVAPMNGFVLDYFNKFVYTCGREPTYDEYKIIMNCFDEECVPVISTLAKEYAVFDRWHCSVPSQTFCNRSFVHSATSHGFVVNAPYYHWVLSRAPTIFNRIEDKNDPSLTWRVYFDELDAFSVTELLQPTTWKYRDTNFKHMEQFETDAAEGTLPSYSFIEPRLLLDNNDQHPRVDSISLGSSVLAGELLVNRIYQAVRNGKKWDKTLFIITYDEHGGNYDHVSPPATVPPDSKNSRAGQYGFKFDRLGVRVPTVMISPYIKKGTVMSHIYDHASIIRTVSKRWHLEPLTERDMQANSFEDALSLTTARTDYPDIKPRPYSALESARDEPIHALQRAILFLVAGFDDACKIKSDHNLLEKAEDLFRLVKDENRIGHIKTVGEALDFLNDFAARRKKPDQ